MASRPTCFPNAILRAITPAFDAVFAPGTLYRATGVILHHFSEEYYGQLDLFGEVVRMQRLSNLYESIVFFAWSILLVYLLFDLKYKQRAVGAFVLRWARRRSVAIQATVVALTSLAAVAAGVLMAAKAMFISAHDLQALFVASTLAGFALADVRPIDAAMIAAGGSGVAPGLPRLLSAAEFGLFLVVNSAVAVPNAIFISGTIQAVSRFVSQRPAGERSRRVRKQRS